MCEEARGTAKNAGTKMIKRRSREREVGRQASNIWPLEIRKRNQGRIEETIQIKTEGCYDNSDQVSTEGFRTNT